METRIIDASILIIGGGPTGLSAAGDLKQAGLESTFLDAGKVVGQSREERTTVYTFKAGPSNSMP